MKSRQCGKQSLCQQDIISTSSGIWSMFGQGHTHHKLYFSMGNLGTQWWLCHRSISFIETASDVTLSQLLVKLLKSHRKWVSLKHEQWKTEQTASCWMKVLSKAFFCDAIMIMMVGFQYRILFCTNWHQLGTVEVCWGCKSKGEFLLLNISTEFISIEHTPCSL